MKLGIWGFGVVGKSYLNFCKNITSVYDSRALLSEELELLYAKKIKVYKNLEKFLSDNEQILLSPGIDVGRNHHKYICELDLFSDHYKKKSIAVTGTLGKTSITRLLGKLLEAKVGGNIGYPMLELIDSKVDLVCLELSSFQLERNKKFAPDIGIITNLYENHLDRHGNIDNYLSAKLNLLKYQNKDQKALVPISLASKVIDLRSQVSFVSLVSTTDYPGRVFYIKDNQLLLNTSKPTVICDNIPNFSMCENMVIVLSTMYLLGLSKNEITQRVELLGKENKTDPHRLELFATFNGVDFYNDSKATIMEATLTAIKKLSSRPIILIIGGLSKGVDRSGFIHEIMKMNNIKRILCLGKECSLLNSICYKSLEDVISEATKVMEPGDQVLFSPGGSSFDLFKNYCERGERFKALIKSYEKRYQIN